VQDLFTVTGQGTIFALRYNLALPRWGLMVLRFLQGRNPDWVQIPFLAKYDEKAIWLDDLKPATGDKFFFEDELNEKMKVIKNEDYPES